jgi:hypothetical protein
MILQRVFQLAKRWMHSSRITVHPQAKEDRSMLADVVRLLKEDEERSSARS